MADTGNHGFFMSPNHLFERGKQGLYTLPEAVSESARCAVFAALRINLL